MDGKETTPQRRILVNRDDNRPCFLVVDRTVVYMAIWAVHRVGVMPGDISFAWGTATRLSAPTPPSRPSPRVLPR